MALELAWQDENALFLVADVLTLVLAAVLLSWDGGRPASRVFAVYLIFRATASLAVVFYSMAAAGGDAMAALWFARIRIFGLLGTPFILIAFAAVYPRCRGWFGRPAGQWTMAGAIAAVFALYLAWPGLVEELRFQNLDGASHWLVESFGPLAIVVNLAVVVEAWLGPWFLREYLRAPHGASGRVVFFLALGFAAQTAFYGAFAVENLSGLAFDALSWPSSMFLLQWSLVLAAFAELVVQFTLGILRARHDRRVQQRMRWGVPFVAIAVLGGSLRAAYWLTGGREAGWPGLETTAQWILGFSWLLLPMFCTYALLRCSMFDIDIRLRFALKQSTVFSIFAAVYFIVSESAQQYFAERVGQYLGIVAAGLLLLAIMPLQRVADRLAVRAVPKGAPIPELGPEERLRLYRDQVELAWQDGLIGVKERMILRNLRDRLGIAPHDAEQLEDEITFAAAGRPVPARPRPAG